MGDSVYHKVANNIASQIPLAGTDPDKLDPIVMQYVEETEELLGKDTEPTRNNDKAEADEFLDAQLKKVGVNTIELRARVLDKIAAKREG